MKKLRITPVQQMLSRFEAFKSKDGKCPQTKCAEGSSDTDVSASNLKTSSTSSAKSNGQRVAHVPNTVCIFHIVFEKCLLTRIFSDGQK